MELQPLPVALLDETLLTNIYLIGQNISLECQLR